MDDSGLSEQTKKWLREDPALKQRLIESAKGDQRAFYQRREDQEASGKKWGGICFVGSLAVIALVVWEYNQGEMKLLGAALLIIGMAGLAALGLWMFLSGPAPLPDYLEKHWSTYVDETIKDIEKVCGGIAPIKNVASLESDDYLKYRLKSIVSSYLYLFSEMPMPEMNIVYYKDYPQFSGKDGNPLYNAFAFGNVICVFREYFEGYCGSDYDAPRLHETLKHEMVHCWINFKKIPVQDAHGPEFEKKFRSILAGIPKFKKSDPLEVD